MRYFNYNLCLMMMITLYDNWIMRMKQINTDFHKWISLISMSRMVEPYLKAYWISAKSPISTHQ